LPRDSYGLGVAVGAFFADAIDTLEKYTPESRDQDEEIAARIKDDAADLGIDLEEAKKLTYLAIAEPNAEIEVPDSALRHLLTVNRDKDLCAIEAHMLAVEGVPAPSIALSHERTPSAKFYRYVRERIGADESASSSSS